MSLQVRKIIEAHGQKPSEFWNEWQAANGLPHLSTAATAEIRYSRGTGGYEWLQGPVTLRMLKAWLGY